MLLVLVRIAVLAVAIILLGIDRENIPKGLPPLKRSAFLDGLDLLRDAPHPKLRLLPGCKI
jgi:hypothetical protein